MEVFFKNSIDLIYKNYCYNNLNFFYYLFFYNLIKKITFNSYLEIFYPKKSILNFEFLNYLNIFESLLGFKPYFKNLRFFFYIITKKKKLIITKKKKFSFLKFKFFLYFNLNIRIFILFLKHFYFILDIYKRISEQFNSINLFLMEIRRFNFNNFQKYEIINIGFLFNFFLKTYSIFINKNNKFFINIYFYNIKKKNLKFFI